MLSSLFFFLLSMARGISSMRWNSIVCTTCSPEDQAESFNEMRKAFIAVIQPWHPLSMAAANHCRSSAVFTPARRDPAGSSGRFVSRPVNPVAPCQENY
jgi:hypothetical protein